MMMAYRIIWANPFDGTEDSAPLTTRGTQAARPHVDRFVSGHALEALEGLVEVTVR
jgi:uncharacterized protein with von Willebrand factor type A (vWA) domain